MVGKTLFALCIFTAGLRVQSLPSSITLSASLPAKSTSPTSIWTNAPENATATTASLTSGTHSNSLLTVTPSAQTSPLPQNNSTEPREEGTTEPASNWEVTRTDPSTPGSLLTSTGDHLTPTPTEHSLSTSGTSIPPTGSQSPAESTTFSSPPAPVSSPASLSTLPPDVSSASVTTDHSSTVTSTQAPRTLSPSASPTEEHSSSHTPASHATTELVIRETTPQATMPSKVTCELTDTETTTASPGVIMEQVEHALSSVVTLMMLPFAKVLGQVT